MRIDITRAIGLHGCVGVDVYTRDTKISFGTFNEQERNALARQFIDAAEKLLEGIKDETT